MTLDDLKQQIKDEPISRIVENYLPLQKRGHHHLGLCPFHSDTNPSLTVNDSKGLFMCFACQVGGDAITFVEKHQNLNFLGALEEIAGILRLNFADYRPKRKADSPELEMALKILSKAAQIYRKIALGAERVQYNKFLGERQLSEESAEKFTLGIAPKVSVLVPYLESIPDLKERERALASALRIGLIREQKWKGGGLADAFSDRLMFPIWDARGQVVAFSGRALTKEQQERGKYINSKESLCFSKKQQLYGFHLAKNAIRQNGSVVLVEGQMDLIALHNAGFDNSLAVMGVGLVDSTLARVISMSKNIYLGLDSDRAGFTAMERMNQLCLEQGVLPRYLSYAPHKDPDDFLREMGRIELTSLIEQAPVMLDLLLERLIPVEIPAISDQKLAILQQAFTIVAPLKEQLQGLERLFVLSKRLGLQSTPDQIQKSYVGHLASLKRPQAKRILPRSDASKREEEPPLPELQDMPVNMEEPNDFHSQVGPGEFISAAERNFLVEVTINPVILTHEKFMELLDYIVSDAVKSYAVALRNLFMEIEQSEYVRLVGNMLEQQQFGLSIKECVGGALFRYQHHNLNDRIIGRLVRDIGVKLQRGQLISKREQLKRMQGSCSSEEEMNSLMLQLMEIQKKLSKIK
jgi:DNA primase